MSPRSPKSRWMRKLQYKARHSLIPARSPGDEFGSIAFEPDGCGGICSIIARYQPDGIEGMSFHARYNDVPVNPRAFGHQDVFSQLREIAICEFTDDVLAIAYLAAYAAA